MTERDAIAGERLKWAREALDYNHRRLAKEWAEYNGKRHGFGSKRGLPVSHISIMDWEEQGVPVKSYKKGLGQDKPIHELGAFFGVEYDIFINPEVSKEEFKDKILFARKKRQGGVLAMLNELVDMVSPRGLDRAYRRHSGYYEGWFYWSAFNDEGKLENFVYRPIIHIGKISKEMNVLKASFYSHRLNYLPLKGICTPAAAGKIFMIFETNPDEVLDEEMSYVFVVLRNKPINELRGLILAESSQPHKRAKTFETLPVSAKILLRKIENKPGQKPEDIIKRAKEISPEEMKNRYGDIDEKISCWVGDENGPLRAFNK